MMPNEAKVLVTYKRFCSEIDRTPGLKSADANNNCLVAALLTLAAHIPDPADEVEVTFKDRVEVDIDRCDTLDVNIKDMP